MKKMISFVGLFAVLGAGIGDAHGVAMSAQVRRLLQEKQEKIEQLEKCEGKKQGWMIAGISTIGLTAVGVGVNIAQASKSNRLSDEIEMEKSTLERHQDELNRINSQISELQAKKAEEEREKRNGERRDYPPVDCSGLNWTGAIVGEKCGLGDAGVWAIKDDGDTDCLNSLDCQKYKCKCVIDLGLGGTGEWTPHAPTLDNPDGKIGETCGDNGEGKWTEEADGTKKCSNANGLVACECVKQTVTTPGGANGKRVVGGACIEEDIKKLSPYGWVSGTYIQVTEKANSTTVLKARCKNAKGDVVPCNCKATECDSSRDYELGSGGLCVKKAAEEKEEEKKQETAEEKKEKQKAPTNQEVILDASVDGIDHCYHIIGQKGYKDCSSSDDWGVTFPNYEVYGEAVCNDDLATPLMVSVSEQTETGGLNCWCKMTRPQESNWVFLGKNSNTDYCKEHCAYECSNLVWHNATFREVLFGSTK